MFLRFLSFLGAKKCICDPFVSCCLRGAALRVPSVECHVGANTGAGAGEQRAGKAAEWSCGRRTSKDLGFMWIVVGLKPGKIWILVVSPANLWGFLGGSELNMMIVMGLNQKKAD